MSNEKIIKNLNFIKIVYILLQMKAHQQDSYLYQTIPKYGYISKNK